MAYDPYEAIKKIYGLKGDWDNYDKAGDKANADKAAAAAKQYYDELIQYGYGDIADTLSKQNYAQAKQTHDRYAMLGKTPANSYLGTLGTQYGLSQSQIDQLISINPTTGEMTFGGKNIGSPYSTVDGITYWDTASLDDIFNDYIKTAGLSPSLFNQYTQQIGETRDKTNQVFDMFGQNNENISKKNNQLWDTIYTDKGDMGDRYTRLEDFNYSNPFTTEQGRSVLERYDLAGLQGRDNQAAIGGANNSGNIDSYSAANALRQQAALRNLGEQSALAAHSRTVNDGRGILGDRGNYLQGVYNSLTNNINTDINQNNTNMDRYMQLIDKYMGQDQNLFDNNETKEGRLFEQDRKTKWDDYDMKWGGYDRESAITGEIPYEVRIKNNPYVNADGTVDENIDYQAIINKATEELKTATDPNRRAYWEKVIVDANDARNIKLGNPEIRAQFGSNMVASYAPSAATKQSVRNSDDFRFGEQQSTERTKDTNQTNKDIAFDTNAKVLEGIKIQSADGKEVSLAQIASTHELGMKGYETQLAIAINNGEVQKFIQTSINQNNAFIATLEAKSRDYAVGSAERIAMGNLIEGARQFDNKLNEDARQFNVTITNSATANTAAGKFDHNFGTASIAQTTAQTGHGRLTDKYQKLGRVTSDDIDLEVKAIKNLNPNGQWDTYANNVGDFWRDLFGVTAANTPLKWENSHVQTSWNTLTKYAGDGFAVTESYINKLANELRNLRVPTTLIEEFVEQAVSKYLS